MTLNIGSQLRHRAILADTKHQAIVNYHAITYINRLLERFPLIPFHELNFFPNCRYEYWAYYIAPSRRHHTGQ